MEDFDASVTVFIPQMTSPGIPIAWYSHSIGWITLSEAVKVFVYIIMWSPQGQKSLCNFLARIDSRVVIVISIRSCMVTKRKDITGTHCHERP